jgi:clan AA aspartic protease
MGHVHAEIEIINSVELELAKRHLMDPEDVNRMHLNVLVDSGAWKLCINENIQEIMELPFIRKEGLRLADGQTVEYDLVGPVLIKFGDRKANCEAIVLPGDTRPLLGVVPMESLNLIIHPLREELVVNPEGPILVGIYKDEAS